MSVDTPENRSYIQRHRLWLLGEVLTMCIIKTRPEKPLTAMIAALERERTDPTETIESPTPEAAAEAKDYLTKFKITAIFEDWLRTTVESKPESPLEFAIAHFQKLAAQHEEYDMNALSVNPAGMSSNKLTSQNSTVQQAKSAATSSAAPASKSDEGVAAAAANNDAEL